MTYIKRLVMHGFKSFVRKTEVPFTQGINVILGPNGSGKSNVSDALCFVLGRLSAKSMRASKSQNLIFLGTKSLGPAKEACVEVVFDNSVNTFGVPEKEISISRNVRRNGMSVYKINNQVKTRQEVLTLLAQAGIDPNGFNIILQGEIQNFVRMHTEERRKIIEEVAGISIYESRKEKSIHELEKTEERLKEVAAILRERTSYLNNLEKERQQALHFKKLEKDVRVLKASIIFSDLSKKKKEKEVVLENILKKEKEIERAKKEILDLENKVKTLETRIADINGNIQKSAGLEQERLNQEIANLRAELAGLTVKSEGHDKKVSETSRRKQELQEMIRTLEVSVVDLQKESPSVARNAKEISLKRQELEKLEEQRKKFYMTKSELKSLRERVDDKKNLFNNYNNESNFLLKQIDSISLELFDKKSAPSKIEELKTALTQKRQSLESLNRREIELEKTCHTDEFEIENQNKVVEKISKLDICPLCKSKITEEHIHNIKDEISPKLAQLKLEIDSSQKELKSIYSNREILKRDIDSIDGELLRRQSDIVKLANINAKKDQIKEVQEKLEKVKQELSELEKRKIFLEQNFDDSANVEEKYETARIEVQEISNRSEENVNSEISFKQRELDRAKISLKQLQRDEEDISEELKQVKKLIIEKENILAKKKGLDEELSKKYSKLLEERDNFQREIRDLEINKSTKQHNAYSLDQEMNNFKIEKARFDAEVENLETEILEFNEVEIVKSGKDILTERLARAQETLTRLGSVNLRSLEVYDSIKKEYDSVREKAEIIAKEKESIMKVIHEIDIKKKKTFLKTLEQLNEIFSRNFAQISTKGQVSLQIENKQDPFAAGIGIEVKTGHGKYFDVTSLSGGEQTMVALSLIFAIQELNPYSFYILDEIDAALDKRNSERLASLLNKYMQRGQYIVITHNDEIISRATNLFGVSMHEGVSKVLSLRLNAQDQADLDTMKQQIAEHLPKEEEAKTEVEKSILE